MWFTFVYRWVPNVLFCSTVLLLEIMWFSTKLLSTNNTWRYSSTTYKMKWSYSHSFIHSFLYSFIHSFINGSRIYDIWHMISTLKLFKLCVWVWHLSRERDLSLVSDLHLHFFILIFNTVHYTDENNNQQIEQEQQ